MPFRWVAEPNALVVFLPRPPTHVYTAQCWEEIGSCADANGPRWTNDDQKKMRPGVCAYIPAAHFAMCWVA